MTVTTAPRDARSMAWQFVAPPGTPEMLAFAEPSDCPAGAVAIDAGDLAAHVRAAGWPAVAAPDLGRTAAEIGDGDAAATTELLAGQVAAGGWLLIGAANAWYPGNRLTPSTLSLARLRRALHRAGLQLDALYLAFPDHRHPAVLAAADSAAALNQMLYRLPTGYVGTGGRWHRTRRRIRTAMAVAAAATPHRLRVRFAPGYLVLARRST
jgi:hypothetical protein